MIGVMLDSRGPLVACRPPVTTLPPSPPISSVQPRSAAVAVPAGLHRFAIGVATAALFLVTVGAFVTSRAAGLSVPDWPLSFGQLNPEGWWHDPAVRAEHGHRLLAGLIALLTVALALWARQSQAPRRARRAAWLAVAAVLIQALLGGLTVLLLVPSLVSMAHAALAHAYLALLVTVAAWTTPGAAHPWMLPATAGELRARARLSHLALATSAALYLQILLGAAVRHTRSGLAIPEFPFPAAGLLPGEWSLPVALNFAHRGWGLVTVALIIAVAWLAWRHRPLDARLLLPATMMLALIPMQVLIGGLVVLSRRAEVPNTLHVTAGALLWTASWMVTLRSRDLAR
jgi:heme a synthase